MPAIASESAWKTRSGTSSRPNSMRSIRGALSICSTRRRYPIPVRFCPWYPLADAAAHAPAAEGVLQLRRAEGLLDYPRGKSAMVHYEYAANVRAVATALAERHSNEALLCRHLEIDPGEAVDLIAFHAKVLEEFLRRFGCPPSFDPCISSSPKK